MTHRENKHARAVLFFVAVIATAIGAAIWAIIELVGAGLAAIGF